MAAKPPDRVLSLNTTFPALLKVEKDHVFDGSDIAKLTLFLDAHVGEVPIFRRILAGGGPPTELENSNMYEVLAQAYAVNDLDFSTNIIPIAFQTNNKHYGTGFNSGVWKPGYSTSVRPYVSDNAKVDAEWGTYNDAEADDNDSLIDPNLVFPSDGVAFSRPIQGDHEEYGENEWKEIRLRSMASFYERKILGLRREEYEAANARLFRIILSVIRPQDHEHVRPFNRDGRRAWAALQARFGGADDTRAGLISNITAAVTETFLKTDSCTSHLDRLGKSMTRIRSHKLITKVDLTVPELLDIFELSLATSQASRDDRHRTIITTLNALDSLNLATYRRKFIEWERNQDIAKPSTASSARATQGREWMHQGSFIANEHSAGKKKTEECWKWVRGTCTLGDHCHRLHSGPPGRDRYYKIPKSRLRNNQRSNQRSGDPSSRPQVYEQGNDSLPSSGSGDPSRQRDSRGRYAGSNTASPAGHRQNQTNSSPQRWVDQHQRHRAMTANDRHPLSGQHPRQFVHANHQFKTNSCIFADSCKLSTNDRLHYDGALCKSHNYDAQSAPCRSGTTTIQNNYDGAPCISDHYQPEHSPQTASSQETALSGGTTPPEAQPWVMDSGSRRHYLNFEPEGFHRLNSRPTIGTASGGVLHGASHGSILPTKDGQFALHGAMFAPGLQHNLVSIGLLCDTTDQHYLHTSDGVYALPSSMYSNTDQLVKVASRNADTGHLYYVNKKRFGINKYALSNKDESIHLISENRAKAFHQKAGHPSPSIMQDILNKGHLHNPGFNQHDLDTWDGVCNGCSLGKATRLPFKSSWDQPPGSGNDEVTVMFDCFGKTRTPTVRGEHYFVLFLIHRSRMTYVRLLQRERDLPSALDDFLIDYHKQFHQLPSTVFCDNASVHISKLMDAILDKRLIKRRTTVPHCSEQNPAERYIRTICTMARTMLQSSGRDLQLWGFAVQAASHLRNRLPCSGNPHNMSPWEMEFGTKPSLDHVQTWGSTAYVATPHDDREQARPESLDAAAVPGILVGYPAHSRGFLIYIPGPNGQCGKVLIRRHVRFTPPGSSPPRESDHNFRHRRAQEYTLRNSSSSPSTTSSSSCERPSFLMDDTPGPLVSPIISSGSPTSSGSSDEDAPASSGSHGDESKLSTGVASAPTGAGSIFNRGSTNVVDTPSPAPLDNDEYLPGAPISTPSSSSGSPSSRGPTTPNAPRRSIDKSLKIDILQDNPKKRGSKAHQRYERYKSAKTIQQLLDLGGTMGDVHWDIKRKFIRLSPHQDEQAHEIFSKLSEDDQLPATVYPDNSLLKNTKVRDIETPANTAESKRIPHAKYWKAARDKEMKQLFDKGVLMPIKAEDIPGLIKNGTIRRNTKPIPGRCVYKAKSDKHGNLKKFKARFVAKGFHQKYGVHYTETYAPCIELSTLRMLISHASNDNMNLFQFDVEGAFLHPLLDEPLLIVDEEGQLYVCFHTLYGLKQSAAYWNRDLHNELVRLGMQPSEADPCLYTRHTDEGVIMLGVWVDDVIGAASNQKLIDDFLNDFKYDFSEGGEFDYCLRIRVYHHEGATCLNQSAAIEDLAAQYRVSDSNPIYTPMEHGADYNKTQMPAEHSDEQLEMSKKPYRNLLGSLLYISGITRPDITTAISILSRFCSNPGVAHWKALKRILIYLFHSRQRSLVYGANNDNLPDHVPSGLGPLSYYVDANHGGCSDTGHSTSGSLLFLNGDCIHHKSKKQNKVCNSTAAAELYAVAQAARTATHMRQIHFDISNVWQRCIPIYTDSQVVVKMIHKGNLSGATKHLRLAFHEVKELVDSSDIQLIHIPGVDNPADILTKPLHRSAHEKHTSTILRDDSSTWSLIDIG